MKEGALQGELPGATATEEAVMHLATHEQHALRLTTGGDAAGRSLRAGR